MQAALDAVRVGDQHNRAAARQINQAVRLQAVARLGSQPYQCPQEQVRHLPPQQQQREQRHEAGAEEEQQRQARFVVNRLLRPIGAADAVVLDRPQFVGALDHAIAGLQSLAKAVDQILVHGDLARPLAIRFRHDGMVRLDDDAQRLAVLIDGVLLQAALEAILLLDPRRDAGDVGRRHQQKKQHARRQWRPVTLMKLLVAMASPLLVFGARCCNSVNSGTM